MRKTAGGEAWDSSGNRAGTLQSAAAKARRRAQNLDPQAWSTAYSGYAAAQIVMSLISFAVPGLVAKMTFGSSAKPLDNQHRQLTYLIGGARFVMAAAAAAVAMDWRRAGWGADTGPRSPDLLRLALAGQALANFLLFGYYGGTISTAAMPFELLLAGAVVAFFFYDLIVHDRLQRGLWDEMKRRLTVVPRTPLALAHFALAWSFPLSGFLLFYFPSYTLYHYFGYRYGRSTFHLAKIAGVADKSLIPVAQLVLKDAAERGGLSSRAAMALNGGMVMAALAHMRVLVPLLTRLQIGWLTPINAATWAAALLTSLASLAVGVMGRQRTVPGKASTASTSQPEQSKIREE